tara:strand:+ start:1395 stop:1562 length:168 start_codon:yes stop_codon:yes gene_type:complete
MFIYPFTTFAQEGKITCAIAIFERYVISRSITLQQNLNPKYNHIVDHNLFALRKT